MRRGTAVNGNMIDLRDMSQMQPCGNVGESIPSMCSRGLVNRCRTPDACLSAGPSTMVQLRFVLSATIALHCAVEVLPIVAWGLRLMYVL